MAKVTAPLMSVTAHGQFGNTLTFRRSPGGPTARRFESARLKPRDQKPLEPTPAQSTRRNRFRAAIESWRALDADDKQDAKQAAYAAGMTALAFWVTKFENESQKPWIDATAPWDDGLVIWLD